MTVGDQVKRRREEKGLSAVELARAAEISKGYLSEIENNRAPRPSGAVLHRLATVLGTTIADLLDKEVRPVSRSIPPSLREYADEAGLPEGDVQMLAQIRFRGQQPVTKQDWAFLYESIRRSMPRSAGLSAQ